MVLPRAPPETIEIGFDGDCGGPDRPEAAPSGVDAGIGHGLLCCRCCAKKFMIFVSSEAIEVSTICCTIAPSIGATAVMAG